jgi:REP element-mobilizing transposase RayT
MKKMTSTKKTKPDLTVFGGALLKGNARIARPLSTKKPVHMVMKSKLAKGERAFSKAKLSKQIEEVVKKLASENNIKLQRYANGGDHLHFVLNISSRKSFNIFLRAISGLIARITLGAERGNPVDKQFWDNKPYTKILESSEELKAVSSIMAQRKPQATGFILN